MDILIASVGTFGLVGAVVLLLFGPRPARRAETLERRLEAVATSGGSAGLSIPLLDHGRAESSWERWARLLFGDDHLAEAGSSYRRLLHQAGFPGERMTRLFLSVRVVLAVALAAGSFVLATISLVPFRTLLLVVAVAGVVGYATPLLFLRRRARLRLRDLEESFPDTLDLLVVCVEGGLGIEAALLRVGQEQGDQGLAIGGELLLVCREMTAGIPRHEALTRMGDRLDSDSLRSLSGFLIQTDELGGSIARSLRVFAESMRQRRRQKAEESVRKLVIRLLLPLALLIMPSLFLVIFAAPVINILKFLADPMGR